MKYNKRLHLTKPLVPPLASARAAPINFAGEANVMRVSMIAKRIVSSGMILAVLFVCCTSCNKEEVSSNKEEVGSNKEEVGSISGAIWAENGVGGTEVLRGVDVYLCGAVVGKSFVKANIKDDIVESLEKNEKLATKHDLSNNQLPDNPSVIEMYRISESILFGVRAQGIVYDCRAALLEFEKFDGKNYVSLMSLYKIYKIDSDVQGEISLSYQRTGMHFNDSIRYIKVVTQNILQAISLSKTAKTPTNVDGKFVFSGLEYGNYVLYSRSDSPGIFRDWCVAVSVNSELTEVDLSPNNIGREYRKINN